MHFSVFLIFTNLCSHHHYLILKQFHHPTKKPFTHYQLLLIILCLKSQENTILLFLYGVAYYLHFMWWNHAIVAFSERLLSLSVVFWRLIRIAACILSFFSLLNSIPLNRYIIFDLFTKLLFIWIIYTFLLLRIILLWALVYTFFGHMFLFSWACNSREYNFWIIW